MPEGEKPKNMREVYPALIIEVCEGDGKDTPFEIIKYAVVDGKLIGKLERNYF